MKNIILFLVILLTCHSLHANSSAESLPVTTLQKLSKSIRGVPADKLDLHTIQGLKSTSEVQEFLNKKSWEYLQTEEFRNVFRYNVEELFKMSLSLPPKPSYDYRHENKISFLELVNDLVKENKSWDQLLLTHKYKIGSPQSDSNSYEFRFYEVLLNTPFKFPSLAETLDARRAAYIYTPDRKVSDSTITFDENDPRIAGVLSTPRFFSRYRTTALNKNRKRAAAIFKIFLCDNMIPVINEANDDSEIKDLSFALGKNLTEEMIQQHIKSDAHGQQADCKACHEKLDPVGQVFSSSNFQLNPRSQSGALFYRRPFTTEIVNEPVSGLNGLAKAIIKQPEYVRCQVQHFWNWYIGEDVPLTHEKSQELVQKFESVGRKPISLIQYLTTRSEFRISPKPLTESQIISRQAIKILKTCNSCHLQNSSDMTNYWDVSALPFGTDRKSRENAIRILKKELNTDEKESKRTMPPASSQWQLSSDQLGLLKKWLDMGAPNIDGRSQLESL